MPIPMTTVPPALQMSRKTLVVVLLSISYALFVVLFPWEEVSRGGFTDYEQYVRNFIYFEDHRNVTFNDHYQIPDGISGWLVLREYFTREALWFELLRRLTIKIGDVEIAIRIISLFILFVWGLFLFKRVSYGVALLFLFNPFVIDVAMSGIRNGLAWSMVMLGLMTQSKWLRGVLFLTGMFVHSTTLVLAIFYYLTRLASRFISGKPLLLVGLGAGICVGLALTVFNELVLGTIGDRRSGENYIVGGGSLLQASLWGILLYLQCMSGRANIKQNIFIIAVLAWYLTMNLFIPWSFRIWGAFLPVIAASAMSLPARKRQIFIFLYSGYLVLQYLYWTKLFDYWYLT
jgi:hypothetical protein